MTTPLGRGAARGVWLVATLAVTSALWPASVRADLDAPDFAPFEGSPVTFIRFLGHKVTRDYVIAREVETQVGQPLQLATLEADLQRLENVGLFAETGVVPVAEGDGVGLTFTFREMPAVLPFPSFLYTEENGFSYGAALSAMNLTGRGISLSARAYYRGHHPALGSSVLSLDRWKPPLLRLLRRQARSRRHHERVRREQLGVHPGTRAPGWAGTEGCGSPPLSSR